MDQAVTTGCSTDLRADPRTNMYVAAALRGPGIAMPVKVRNMSIVGALIEAPTVPNAGTNVHLLRGSLSVAAEVAWSVPGRCGLRFSSAVSVARWLAAPANGRQSLADHTVSIVKLGAIPLAAARDRESADTEVRTFGADQLAEVLRGGCRLIEDLADELANDASVIQRYGDRLQNLDIAVQSISAVAMKLTTMDSDDASLSRRLNNLRKSCAETSADRGNATPA